MLAESSSSSKNRYSVFWTAAAADSIIELKHIKTA